MKNILFSLILSFCYTVVVAQHETQSYKSTVNSFKESFNKEDYESIFGFFSAEMKEYLPYPIQYLF